MRLPILLSIASLLLAPVARAQQPAPDARIAGLLDRVSAARLDTLVRTLAGFGTRNTLSDTGSTSRGIGAARRWIFGEFQRAGARLEVSYDTYQIPPGGRITRPVELRNVVAILPGRSPRRIYVSGHYDTVSRPPEGGGQAGGDHPAPGANDDGSGTALVLELARVVASSGLEFDATLVFVAFAGEEQGLVGATRHAGTARAEAWTIDAVLNNDIVGNTLAGNGRREEGVLRVFADGPEDGPSRQLARYVRDVAARYLAGHEVRPVARADRFGRGGDHTPFHQAGYAAVRFTEAAENYSRQHTPEDTPDGVDAAYLARNARVNLAALASLALAPPAPVITTGSGQPTIGRGTNGYDATLRWQPVPGATGYRVVWRKAWAMEWEESRLTGAEPQAALPGLSIDDYVFGVAAVGPGGHESLVSAYMTPPRRAEPRPAGTP
jgi:hypothetical protein